MAVKHRIILKKEELESLIAEGLTKKQIRQRLGGISKTTLRSYLKEWNLHTVFYHPTYKNKTWLEKIGASEQQFKLACAEGNSRVDICKKLKINHTSKRNLYLVRDTAFVLGVDISHFDAKGIDVSSILSLTQDTLVRIANEAKSKAEMCRKIGVRHTNGNINRIDNLLVRYNISFQTKCGKIESKKIVKPCPVCKNNFLTTSGKKEGITCSVGCANTYFRSGENHPLWKPIEEKDNESKYREICFLHHPKECVVCKENKIVSVHHFDENPENNSPENLIPLCPTHHTYWHSRYKLDV